MLFPKEEMEMKPSCPSQDEVAGPSGVDPMKDKSEYYEVKWEVKPDNIDVLPDGESDREDDKFEEDAGNSDSDFDVKKEESDKDDYSETDDETLKEILQKEIKRKSKEVAKCKKEILEHNFEDYKSILIKSYTTMTIQEEPYENIKVFFKDSPIEIEKQQYHQQICEQILDNSKKLKLKDLQAQYMEELRQAANIEIFTCSLCSYQTMNLKNLRCHLIASHNGKTEHEVFKCNKCDYETNFNSHITRHMIIHKTSKEKTQEKTKRRKEKIDREKYPCPECNYQGRSENGLKAHMTLHKDKTKCDLCTFQSDDKKLLKDHKDTHKIGNIFHCYECDYRNGNKLTLALHLKKKHNIDNEMSKRSKICEVCSFAAVDRYKLQQHYMTHKTVKDLKEDEIFRCDEEGCLYQTKLKAHLAAHVRIHKPPEFICEVCGFATTRKQNYKFHLETHKKLSEIEWLPCPICPYQGRTKRHLYQHMKIGAHDDKNRRHIRRRNLEAEGLPIPPPRNIKKKREENKEDGIDDESVKKPKRKRKPKAKKMPQPSLDEPFVNFDQLASAFLVRNEALS